MPGESVVLEVKQLSKIYKGDLLKPSVHALKDVNCRFIEGTINLLLGHNGAGKTTTIQIILDLIKPTSGEVLFYGKPMRIEDKKNIGYMPEIHRLAPLLTPYETISNHLRYFDDQVLGDTKKQVITRHLHRLGLYEHRKKKVKELSKGLRRRVAYILAVIHRPTTLILDEPFSGLDLAGKQMMEGLLLEQKNAGNTLIVSSHDVASSFKMCDHFHILKDGSTAFSSLADDLTKQLDDYEVKVAGLEAARLDHFTQGSGAIIKSASSEGFAHRLVVEGYEGARGLLSALFAEGVLVQSFKPITEADQMVQWISTKLMSEMPVAAADVAESADSFSEDSPAGQSPDSADVAELACGGDVDNGDHVNNADNTNDTAHTDDVGAGAEAAHQQQVQEVA